MRRGRQPLLLLGEEVVVVVLLLLLLTLLLMVVAVVLRPWRMIRRIAGGGLSRWSTTVPVFVRAGTDRHAHGLDLGKQATAGSCPRIR
jgi:hypothetical protein